MSLTINNVSLSSTIKSAFDVLNANINKTIVNLTRDGDNLVLTTKDGTELTLNLPVPTLQNVLSAGNSANLEMLLQRNYNQNFMRFVSNENELDLIRIKHNDEEPVASIQFIDPDDDLSTELNQAGLYLKSTNAFNPVVRLMDNNNIINLQLERTSEGGRISFSDDTNIYSEYTNTGIYFQVKQLAQNNIFAIYSYGEGDQLMNLGVDDANNPDMNFNANGFQMFRLWNDGQNRLSIFQTYEGSTIPKVNLTNKVEVLTWNDETAFTIESINAETTRIQMGVNNNSNGFLIVSGGIITKLEEGIRSEGSIILANSSDMLGTLTNTTNCILSRRTINSDGSADNSIVFGNAYTGVDSVINNSLVIGNELTIASTINNTIFSGYNNIVNNSNDNIISGMNNIINITGIMRGNVISGEGTTTPNDDKSLQYNISSGQGNILAGDINNNILSGYQNTINDSSNSLVIGNSNEHRGVNTIMGGSDNNVMLSTATPENIIISGYQNIVDSSYNSIISGDTNSIENTNNSLLIGALNEASGRDNVLIVGNNIIASDDNAIYANKAHIKEGIALNINNSITNVSDTEKTVVDLQGQITWDPRDGNILKVNCSNLKAGALIMLTPISYINDVWYMNGTDVGYFEIFCNHNNIVTFNYLIINQFNTAF